jgi:hypothetical protein
MRLPKKLIIAGKYVSLPLAPTYKMEDISQAREFPFVGLVDTSNWGEHKHQRGSVTMIKCFQYETEGKQGFFKKNNDTKVPLMEITALSYGPYDNGHIIVGFNTGFILILNSLDLSGLFRIQVFDPI